MAVVINEFEVMPQTPKSENPAAKKEDKKGGGNDQPPTDHEVSKMLQQRVERLERVSTY